MSFLKIIKNRTFRSIVEIVEESVIFLRKQNMSKKIWSAIHSENSFLDAESIWLLISWITKTWRAMPDFKFNDKFPNLDWYIEILNIFSEPIWTMKVQVKTLEQDCYKKTTKEAKYSFKTDNFLNYCRNSWNLVPIILIWVDLDRSNNKDNQKAYWLEINHKYLEKLGDSKTIIFPKENLISSKDVGFILEWEKITLSYISEYEEFNKNRKMYSILSDIQLENIKSNSALFKKDNKFYNIHKFLDTYNYLVDINFKIVKKIFYGTDWKVWFAYSKYTDKSLNYTLYPLPFNSNDVQIKEVNDDVFLEFRWNISLHFQNNPIEENPEWFAKELLKTKLRKILDEKLLIHSWSEILSREYIFAFIDKFKIQMWLDEKDTYSIEEIEYWFYSFLPNFCLELYNLRKNKKWIFIDKWFINPDDICFISNNEQSNILNKVKNLDINKFDNNYIISFIKNWIFSMRIFIEFLDFLKREKIIEINRVYKKKNYSRLDELWTSLTFNVFSKDDAEYNTDVFYKNIANVFNKVIENNFSFDKQNFTFSSMSKNLFYSNFKDKYENSEFPILEVFWLEQLEWDIFDKIPENEFNDIENQFSKEDYIYYKNKIPYKIVDHSTFKHNIIYDDTPMFSYIYESIKEKIKKFLK